MENHIVVLCTVGSEEESEKLARALVEEKLVACVNILNGIRSIYRWENEVCDDPELLLVMKTARTTFDALEKRIVELHSYDTPEIIALPIVAGHHPYLSWIDTMVGSR